MVIIDDFQKNFTNLNSTTGLRIYYTEIENTIVLLFTGGNKFKQIKDIETATKYLNDYNERKQ